MRVAGARRRETRDHSLVAHRDASVVQRGPGRDNGQRHRCAGRAVGGAASAARSRSVSVSPLTRKNWSASSRGRARAGPPALPRMRGSHEIAARARRRRCRPRRPAVTTPEGGADSARRRSRPRRRASAGFAPRAARRRRGARLGLEIVRAARDACPSPAARTNGGPRRRGGGRAAASRSRDPVGFVEDHVSAAESQGLSIPR